MGAIVCTGRGVELYRLMALRQAVRLESRGIRLRRWSMRMAAARQLGIPGARPSYESVLAALEERITGLAAVLEPHEVREVAERRG